MSPLHRRLGAIAAVAAAGALVLTGCQSSAGTASSDASSAPAPADAAAFPVTIPTMYGDAVIESAPTRVATWGWGATDAVLALGVQPVAIPSDDFGGGDDKISPWVKDAIDELGGEAPVVLDASTYELPVEELLATNPDVLVTPYSGITEEEYKQVTDAGIPVVAPETAVWSTPWRDVISETGEALGLTEKSDALLADLDGQIADAAEANPEFSGTTIGFVTANADTVYAYLPADSRQELLEDLGFTTDPAIIELDSGESTFYTTVSQENLDKIDADVIFTYATSQEEYDTFLTSARTTLIPAVKKGAVASVVGLEQSDAISPTALTLPYILPDVIDQLVKATAVAKG